MSDHDLEAVRNVVARFTWRDGTAFTGVFLASDGQTLTLADAARTGSHRFPRAGLVSVQPLEALAPPLDAVQQRRLVRAVTLRTVGQVVTVIGSAGVVAGVLWDVSFAREYPGHALGQVIVLGAVVAPSLLVVGAGGAMWGVGERQRRRAVAVAAVPVVLRDGGGMAIVGSW